MNTKVTSLRIVACITVALAGLCAVPREAVAAKYYRVPQVVIDARLAPDGTMDVTEQRTYEFRGAFKFAYRDLPAADPVVFEDFTVSEGGHPYALSDSESPGTYEISKVAGRTRVTWFYEARDQTRTFTFAYRVRNTVARYEDAAVLYFKFIGEEWSVAQDEVTVRLEQPVALARDQIKEWLHGPLWAESSIGPDGSIVARCPHLPARTYLEMRVLYPPDAFADLEAGPSRVRDEIMTEEARWADEANSEREAAARKLAAREGRRAIAKWVVIPVGLAGLLVSWWILRTYGRRPEVPSVPDVNSEIPEQISPALVGYLLGSRQISGSALVGTMLDLARRGFIALREEKEEKRGLWGGTKLKPQYYWDLNRSHFNRRASELAEHESSLLDFIFNGLAKGQDSISIEAIGKKRREFTKFFGQWKGQVAAHGKRSNWFDADSVRGMYYSFAVAGVMVASTVVGALVFGPWAVVLAGVSVAVLILSLAVPHRTPEGETKARQWRAVKRYLKRYQFRTADQQGLLAHIPDYLVYGAVLGLGGKIHEELSGLIPANAHGTYIPWYVYHGSTTGSFSPAAFGSAFSAMVATATSTMSTAAGAGGGASGGGGGGAGGGGGGAG